MRYYNAICLAFTKIKKVHYKLLQSHFLLTSWEVSTVLQTTGGLVPQTDCITM